MILPAGPMARFHEIRKMAPGERREGSETGLATEGVGVRVLGEVQGTLVDGVAAYGNVFRFVEIMALMIAIYIGCVLFRGELRRRRSSTSESPA